MSNRDGGSSPRLPALGDHVSLQERTYRALRNALVTGQFQLGERLYETDLAATLGVSRNPVREAIRRLQQDGLVEVRPRSGIFVASISLDDADDIYRIRGALEGIAARLAAERATESEIAEMDRLLSHPHRAVRRSTGKDAVVIDADSFHRAIYECAHSTSLSEMLAVIYARVFRYRSVTLQFPGRPEVVMQSHRELFGAIARRDGNKAEALMREHVEGARRSLMEHFSRENVGALSVPGSESPRGDATLGHPLGVSEIIVAEARLDQGGAEGRRRETRKKSALKTTG
ncbi:MAG: GntR family transcriptional regulator [Candidatus Dormiibacterota bacterium]